MRDAAEERAASGLTPSRFVQGGLAQFASDKPTIGLLPCRSKDRIVVEYALRDLKKPIGVAGWETKIVEKLPENLKGSLPTVEGLEAEFSREENER